MKQTARQPFAVVAQLRQRYVAGQARHAQIVLAAQLGYAALFTGWLAFNHTWPAPDIVAMFLLFFAFLAARGLSFLRDWSPFVLLVLGYIALGGVANRLIAGVHVQFPIDGDRALSFGHLPTLWLQAWLWTPGRPQWYDYAASVLYSLHFIVPLVLAFIFWMWKKRLYWKFVASYLLLCYAGFLTYLLYPMAPPWWAAEHHRIPAMARILDEVRWGGVSNPVALATQFFSPNPVAAMPSIHAAFPVLVWLVLWKVWPRWGWAMVLYPLAMDFSVVYLGEHYCTDVLAGSLYALAAFALIWGRHTWLRGRIERGLRQHMRSGAAPKAKAGHQSYA